MMARKWSKGNTITLIRGVQTFIASIEIFMMDPQKIGNLSTSRPSHTFREHICKGNYILPQGYMLN